MEQVERPDQIDMLPEADPAKSVAKRIATEVVALPSEQARFISYSQLAHFGGVEPADGLLLKCIAVLTSERMNLLNVFYVYESASGEEHKLSHSEIEQAKKHGYLVDPDSGEKVEQFRKYIYPYFERV